MQWVRCMSGGGHIDRKKHEVDITERVLDGGVWTGPHRPESGRVVNIELDRRAWSFGTLSSSVQIEVAKDDEGDER
jgi:hypothetical protein